MPHALVIYAAALDQTRIFAEKVKKRLVDLAIEVSIIPDEKLKSIKSFSPFDVIFIGATCRSCTECHGAEDCRAPRHIKKRLLKRFPLNLAGKKLVTFALCDDLAKQQCICQSIEDFMTPTGISPTFSISCASDPSSYEDVINATIQEQLFE
ncbi:MAG TPA: hypothetical protein VKK79_23490 [Candidatus Lokiarchaeia archaeon]|nr:hypothetical protein [Candidatus Lokiarchaeia archaeon]